MTSPEQSTPYRLAPPHWYQTPRYDSAASTAILARESGGGAGKLEVGCADCSVEASLAAAAAWAWAMKVAICPLTWLSALCREAW